MEKEKYEPSQVDIEKAEEMVADKGITPEQEKISEEMAVGIDREKKETRYPHQICTEIEKMGHMPAGDKVLDLIGEFKKCKDITPHDWARLLFVAPEDFELLVALEWIKYQGRDGNEMYMENRIFGFDGVLNAHNRYAFKRDHPKYFNVENQEGELDKKQDGGGKE